MTTRLADIGNVPAYEAKLTALAAEITGHDPAELGYLLIVTSFDERGQTLFTNAPAVEQTIALMCAVLHAATRHFITGEPVEVVPPG